MNPDHIHMIQILRELWETKQIVRENFLKYRQID